MAEQEVVPFSASPAGTREGPALERRCSTRQQDESEPWPLRGGPGGGEAAGGLRTGWSGPAALPDPPLPPRKGRRPPLPPRARHGGARSRGRARRSARLAGSGLGWLSLARAAEGPGAARRGRSGRV